MNVKIRPWVKEDAKALSNAINNKKILDNLRDGLPYPYTQEDAKDYIIAMQNSLPNTTYAFAIDVDGVAIGSIGVFRKENIHYRTGEMGYYIAQEYWGKGIGSEAVKLTCRYIFENTDIVRIFAEPFSHNIASCRILEKSGFYLEGIMRKNAQKNGEFIDIKLYALVKE